MGEEMNQQLFYVPIGSDDEPIPFGGKVAEISSEIHKYSIIALSAVCVCGIIEISTPQAIDVYRGRTTLEITYKDSIPVDSVVVFKLN